MDLFKAQLQIHPQISTKDIFLDYKYPYQPTLPTETNYHVNDYTHNQQLAHRYQNKPPQRLPFPPELEHFRKLAQIRDDNFTQFQPPIIDKTAPIQPLLTEHFRFPAPLYIQHPIPPKPTNIPYTTIINNYALLNEKLPTFTYIDLDNLLRLPPTILR